VGTDGHKTADQVARQRSSLPLIGSEPAPGMSAKGALCSKCGPVECLSKGLHNRSEMVKVQGSLQCLPYCTVLYSTTTKFLQSVIQQSGNPDNLALEEKNAKIGNSTNCNLRYAYWFHEYLGLSGFYVNTTNFLSKQDTSRFHKSILSHTLKAYQTTSKLYTTRLAQSAELL
jgi:hypothetical protein